MYYYYKLISLLFLDDKAINAIHILMLQSYKANFMRSNESFTIRYMRRHKLDQS